ncbi:MAG: hypothetical protein AAFU85_23870 [Planctomycetota bacterium]
MAITSESERAKDAQRKRDQRARERDLIIPPIADKARRLEKEQDDAAWMRYYFPDVFYSPFTEDQKNSIGEVARSIEYGTKKCIAGPRGDGKTSITKYRLAKGLLRKRVDGEKWGHPECPFAMYVGASDPKATQSDQAIRHHLRTACIAKPGSDREFIAHSRLGQDYPFECSIISYVARAPSRANNVTTNGGWKIHVQWANGLFMPSLEFGDAHEAWEKWMIRPGVLGAALLACGITGSVLQGANILDVRPTAVILDDLDNRESLAADKRKKNVDDGAVAEKICEIINKTISGMKGQGRPMGQVMLCTVTSRKSVAFRYSDPTREPSWGGVRKKRIIDWPVRMDLWEKYMDLRRKGQQKRGEDGEPIDPHAREAHSLFLENYDEMWRGVKLGNDHIHDETILPDGTKTQEDTLQWCFDYIADEGMEAFKTEYQQEPPEEDSEAIQSQLTQYHVSDCVREDERFSVDNETHLLCSGIDVRKVELHELTVASSKEHRYQIPDYDVHGHAPPEITEEMAESAILQGLHALAKKYDDHVFLDRDGVPVARGVTLIDKGWMGSWRQDDGTLKTWATQPVETFCRSKGLRYWLPAKGHPPPYRSPPPSDAVIVGPHWHMNRGAGAQRTCTEVIWDTMHYRCEIEKAFQTEDPENRIALFEPVDGIHTGHRRLSQHVLNGVKGLVEMRQGKTPTPRRDHWWDALAMSLVALSIEDWFRKNFDPHRSKPRRPAAVASRHEQAEEIGAR